MSLNKEDYVIELDTTYDRRVLLGIFEQAKPYARIKGLGWQDNSHLKTWSTDTAPAVVIYSGDYMNMDPNLQDLNYDFLQHKYIRQLVEQINLDKPINKNNVDMIWYRPGFCFEPHIDHYAMSTLMWPVIPENGGAPIDFYYKSNIDLNAFIQAGKPAGFKNDVTEQDIIDTHFYSTTSPTVFNSHWIHGVRPVQEERVYLRLRINEPYESLLIKHRTGTLIR
jgi:hypothetical protein